MQLFYKNNVSIILCFVGNISRDDETAKSKTNCVEPDLAQCASNLNRIVGGAPVFIKDYPYQLSLSYNNTTICGATLIGHDTALTAAHCIIKNGTYTVRAGSSYANKNGQVVKVKRAILHPSFKKMTNDFDICILKLETQFRYTRKIQPALLPSQNEYISPGMRGNVSGWGRNNPYSFKQSMQLRAVEVLVVNKMTCKYDYNMIHISPRMFCAGYVNGGRDSCQGDSGGPFIANGKLYGIISWGLFCGMAEYPGVYTNVALFRNFIKINSAI